MIVIVDMRGHSEIIPSRVHAVIYRGFSSKHRKADERQRKRISQKKTIQPTEHPSQVSIICKEHSFEETISHMKIDKRQDAAMYGRRLVPLRNYFCRKQERRLAVQTSSN
jgi:hypothetical protein